MRTKLEIVNELRREVMEKRRKLTCEMFKLDDVIKTHQVVYKKLEDERNSYLSVSNYLYEQIEKLRKELHTKPTMKENSDDEDD